MLCVIERVATKRTAARVAALEPTVQAASVEHVSACPTSLIRQLPLSADNAVTNSTLGLTLECRCDILSPSQQALDQRAAVSFAAEVDDPLRCDYPTSPFPFVDSHAVNGFNGSTRERVGARQANCDRHGLLIYRNRGRDFACRY